MREALREAEQAYHSGEVPIGAVVVRDGDIIGRGHNRREALADPTAHAEILAIRDAARRLGGWRVERATLYVTIEPCSMCAGALLQARIAELVYGASEPKFGAVGSIVDLLQNDRFNHRVAVTDGVLQEECAEIMRRFFRERRGKPNGDGGADA